MSNAKVWIEKINISTYEAQEAEKNPIFLEQEGLQRGSGHGDAVILERHGTGT